MQARDDMPGRFKRWAARVLALAAAAAVALAAGCASGVPVAAPRGVDAPPPNPYAGLSFDDLPLAAVQKHDQSLRPAASRRGWIAHVVRAPAGGLAAGLLDDAVKWCAGNLGEPGNDSQAQEISNQVIDILKAEYKLARPAGTGAYVCRSQGRVQAVVTVEAQDKNLPVYVVWTTDTEIGAALASLITERARTREREDQRKSNESRRRVEASGDKQKRATAVDEQASHPDPAIPAGGTVRSLKALDADFAELDQRLYRPEAAGTAPAFARDAATAASKVVANALGPVPAFQSSAEIEPGLGPVNLARLGYFANGVCTLRVFRPYQQSAVDLRKVNWDAAEHSIHAVKEHVDAAGIAIPGDGTTAVRFNLLTCAVDVDSTQDAERLLKAARVIAAACLRGD